MLVEGFDPNSELAQASYSLLRPSWKGTVPILINRPVTSWGGIPRPKSTNGRLKYLASYWNTLSRDDKLLWYNPDLADSGFMFGNFIQNNDGRLRFGLPITLTADPIPKVCGFLRIPSGRPHVQVRFGVTNPWFTFSKIPSTRHALQLVTNDLQYLRNVDSFIQLYRNNSSDSSGYHFDATFTRTTSDGSGGHVFDSHTFSASPVDGLNQYIYGSSPFFPSTPYSAELFSLLLDFHGMSGDFFFPFIDFSASGIGGAHAVFTRDGKMADIGEVYAGHLSQVVGGWELAVGAPGVIFETTIPAKYGLT